jgi:NAD(P)-dependent dehydrogenase (short-subunit alcohol dehydrogenase family)
MRPENMLLPSTGEIFTDRIAVVTGASNGISKAITLALAVQGTTLCLVGRKIEILKLVAKKAKFFAVGVLSYQVDLTSKEKIKRLKEKLHHDLRRVDLLFHSADVIPFGNLETAAVEDFDLQYRTNVRAPYLLTQALFPMLKTHQGQIVFINSSVGLTAKAGVGQYAATKHALKAIADSLRAEINDKGLRVLSVYPGYTASPRQAALCEIEGKAYQSRFLYATQRRSNSRRKLAQSPTYC